MQSRVKIFGHPVHQILVMFPIGMMGFGVACDALSLFGNRARWAAAARAAIGGAVAGGAVAAPFGLVDYLAIPRGTRAKAIGRAHGLGNVAVLSAFLGSYLARRGTRRPSPTAVALSTGGLLTVCATAWLGTELINRLGVGVPGTDHERMNAPSSLRDSRLLRRIEVIDRHPVN